MSKWKIVTGVTVSTGSTPRLTIPKSFARKHGFDEDTIVDVKIYDSYPSDDPVILLEEKIQSGRRIGVEPYRLSPRGINRGDKVDLLLRHAR